MRTLFALSVSAALVLGLSGPASAAKSNQRSVQNFRAAHGAVIRAEPETVTRPGYYFPGYGVIPREQNRNLDPSNWGGG
jgi:ABC-type arginine transport system permease subunit